MTIFFLILLNLFAIYSLVEPCSNIFDDRNVRVVGDWQINPWFELNPHGLMKYDPKYCMYSLVIGGINANRKYEWKVNLQ